ncbi:MAG: hypothetical protein RLZZ127_677 [Planctomycetota bacterium]|jgi:signal transduction histidine kinase
MGVPPLAPGAGAGRIVAMPWSPELVDRLPVGLVLVDDDGCVRAANHQAQDLFSRPLRIGLRIEALAEAVPHPVGWERLAPGSEALLAIGPRLVRLRCEIDRGMRAWILQDISEEFRLRAKLAEQASSIAHANDAFLVLSQDGIVRYANEHAEGERGAGPGGLVGLRLHEIERTANAAYEQPRDQDLDAVRARLASVVQSGRPLRYHAWHRRLDAGELPVEVCLRPHRLSHEQVVLMTARDDSRRLMHLQALTQAKAEAEQANRTKSAFLAITSHELRTPLTGIIGFCELLQLEIPGESEDAQRYLRLIGDSSQSLLGIINDILDLSKIEARTLELKPGFAEPDQVLDLIVRLWRPRAEAKGLEFVRRPSAGRIDRISTDVQRLRQMLENLVGNAVKFTDRGRVVLAVDAVADGIEFTISDTGPGIPEEARDSIFKAFWQAADHTTRAVGGNGLGLYITRSLATLLGGRVWLDGSGADGSVFKLHLPRTIGSKPSGRILKSDLWLRPVP